MPSAAWIAASKKTPMEPVFYAACESVEAINVTQRLASDWTAGVMSDTETFNLPGLEGGAGVRPKLYHYTNTDVSWWDFGASPPINPGLQIGDRGYSTYENAYREYIASGGKVPHFAAPVDGYVESVTAYWMARHNAFNQGIWNYGGNAGGKLGPWNAASVGYLDQNGNVSGSNTYNVYLIRTTERQVMPMLSLGVFAQGATVPFVASRGFGTVLVGGAQRGLYPQNEAGMSISFRAKTGTIRTKVFDLGTGTNSNSRVLIDDMVTGASSMSYTAEGSANNSTWVNLGDIQDGGEMAPYRYYRITATFHSTGYDTPELYSIRVIGGNKQYVNLGTHRNEPSNATSEVYPYIQEVSSASSKISIKDKPTVGDLTLKLAWMPVTADLVQSTGKRRNVSVYIGFTGLPIADYEPYFTGIWESYTADQDKRFFTVKLRDVWKKFKKKIPEQLVKNGVNVPINWQFGKALGGVTGTSMNIIDAITQVADLAKAPDRYIDKAALAALKTAHFNSSDWNVYRVLTEQKDSDELLRELSVTAGVFLVPATNGKLTPLHYDTILASTPAVTLDAAKIKFTNLTPDMAETVTRHNIFFNLLADASGRKLGGSDPGDYGNVYTTMGSTACVVAERDREEVVVGEWFDNWGLAANAANGTPNPLTKLADRLESWYTPIATVNGKQVATTKTSVRAEGVPLRHWADVQPGKTVMVDNLRLPCPVNSWGGFSNQVKFLVLAWNVDPKKFTITLDLFQISPLTYTAAPTWSTYSQWDAFPSATYLSLSEHYFVAADGSVKFTVWASFSTDVDYRAMSYELWYSTNGGEKVLFNTFPAKAGQYFANIPAESGASYTVTVITVNSRGVRQPVETAPTESITVEGVVTAGTLPGAVMAGAIVTTTEYALQATKNTVTYGDVEPVAATNGDLWCNTAVTPNVWKVRVGGVWKDAATFTDNTNQLTDGAGLGTTAVWSGVSGVNVATDQIDTNAVTVSAVSSVGAQSIAGAENRTVFNDTWNWAGILANNSEMDVFTNFDFTCSAASYTVDVTLKFDGATIDTRSYTTNSTQRFTYSFAGRVATVNPGAHTVSLYINVPSGVTVFTTALKLLQVGRKR